MTAEANENPWLSIPASDYEAHMGDSGAKQLGFLSEVFGNLLREFHPEKVAVLGCATGNGFEHVQPNVTRLLIGIDLNPEYLAVARRRYADKTVNLQLHCSDIRNVELEPRSLDLLWCGLFFEHVDPKLVSAKVFRWLKPGGVFATVLQLPVETAKTVSDTGIESIKRLENVTELVDPVFFAKLAESAKLRPLVAETRTLETGKSFRVLVFRQAT